MGLFEHFPYTNFHELNLGWFLDKFKALLAEWGIYKPIFEGIRDEAEAAAEDAAEALAAAETAQGSAETALAQANTAITTANTAVTEAQTARAGAETAQAGAEAALDGAETAWTGAQDALTDAVTAKNAAVAAQTAAETANTAAQGAKTAAQAAQTGAETASTAAQNARTRADSAMVAAETAADVAEDAADAAETAQAGAEQAATFAEGGNYTPFWRAIDSSTPGINPTVIQRNRTYPESFYVPQEGDLTLTKRGTILRVTAVTNSYVQYHEIASMLVDKTLTLSDYPADAKTVGDALAAANLFPDPPATDGVYTAKVTVTNGVPSYGWNQILYVHSSNSTLDRTWNEIIQALTAGKFCYIHETAQSEAALTPITSAYTDGDVYYIVDVFGTQYSTSSQNGYPVLD